MITIEQVEKLRSYANVTYDEAKTVLEATDGDILEAVVLLEKQGKVEIQGGKVNDSKTKESDASTVKTKPASKGATFGDYVNRFFSWCGKIIHHGNANTFKVQKDNADIVCIPVTAFILLLIFAFWVVTPLLVIGLFCGLRYSFHGPDLGKEKINNAMNKVADEAEKIKGDIQK